MGVADYVILVLLACGLVNGLIEGLIRQAFSLGGLVLGLICGSFLYRPASDYLQAITSGVDVTTTQIVAFVLILVTVPICCGLVGRVLSKLVRIAMLGPVDRLLGMAFGFAKWFLLIGLTMQFLSMSGMEEWASQKGKDNPSVLYEPVRKTTDFCLHWIWDQVSGEIPFEKEPGKREPKDKKRV